ncbi:FmdB family zinc ribbon protein [Pseudonocardia alni]|uniref:FmdB family zinc ribbon protein n=1 Tax=Pseudonocardia alni TaxID=33907 RepID=UPI0033FEC36C
MPTYQYACTACDHRFEAVQSFSDDALSTCPNCGGKLRKVFSSVGIVFKGSGFYRTDSRSGSVSSGSGSSSESAKSDSSSSSSASSDSSSSSGSSSSSDSSSSSSSSSSAGTSSSKAAAS